MGPKELQPNDISLFESLGIDFFKALFIIIDSFKMISKLEYFIGLLPHLNLVELKLIAR